MAIEDNFIPGTSNEIALLRRIRELKHGLYDAGRIWALERVPDPTQEITAYDPAPRIILPMTEYICLDDSQRIASVNAVSWAGKEKPGQMYTCRYSFDLDMFRDTGEKTRILEQMHVSFIHQLSRIYGDDSDGDK